MTDGASSQSLKRFLAASRERLARLTVAWVQHEQDRNAESVAMVLRELHTLKGEAGLLGLSALAEKVHALEDSVAAISAEGAWTDEGSESILDAIDGLLAVVEKLADEHTHKPASKAAKPAGITWKKKSTGRGTTVDIRVTTGSKKPTTFPEVEVAPSAPARTEGTSAGDGVYVSAALVDRIRDLVGDLMLTRARLHGHLSKLGLSADGEARELRDDIERMGSLIGGLEELARDVRMVRISQLFDGYHRLVRDLAKQLGKEVRLRTSGASVHVDRDVLEAISEPLLHLLRNAVDHGIEAPDARERSNKRRVGEVSLAAEVRGSTIEVRISDDGRGVDVSAVRERAAELGLIGGDEVEELQDADALALIFEPGMTTRREVSGVSGRGVGLDVVRENLAAIGGTLALESNANQGTTFTLRAPISFALSSVLLFRVGHGRYALVASAILAVVDSEYHERVEDVGGAKLRYSGDLIPLVSLSDALAEAGDGDGGAESPGDGLEVRLAERYIVAATGGGGLVAFSGAVEHEPRDAVLIPLERLQRQRHPVSAGFMLEDGSIALVLNPAELGRRRGRAERRRRRESAAPAQALRVADTVLVVDDSALIRELIVEVFREHGVAVLEAADGLAALQLLRKEQGRIALLVTDVEMPMMSGLELIASVRQDERLRDLPAVVVSTKSSEADKEAAKRSGANDYLVKADFSKGALWDKVARYLPG